MEWFAIKSDDFIAALIKAGVLHPTTKNVRITAEAGDEVILHYDEFEDGVSNLTLRRMNGGDVAGLTRLNPDDFRSGD